MPQTRKFVGWMKLLACLITFNRLEYTKRTIQAWQASHGPDDHLVISDNASTDGTVERLTDSDFHVIFNKQNWFPGAACNIGWHHGLKRLDADLLMRLDNDVELKPGWRKWVERYFKAMPRLGQLGILNAVEDYGEGRQPWEKIEEHGVELYLTNPGGPSVIRRELYDRGLRWMPGSWRPGGADEDSKLSDEVRSMGFIVGRIVPTVATNQSFHRFEEYPDYYRQTAALRGLVPETSV